MSANKIKFWLGIIAMTGFAALSPVANAAIAKPAAVSNILNRANLNVDSSELQQHNQQSTPSVQQLPGGFKLAAISRSNNSGCSNNSCRRSQAVENLSL